MVRLSTGAGRGADDVQLLGGDGRANQYDGFDARHRRVDARGHVQVPGGDFRARIRLIELSNSENGMVIRDH
jgi:hypothetical protein